MAFAGLLILFILPGLTRRRRFVRALARVALQLAGMPVELRGQTELPTPCILVANHCSYIDGVVLTATLPPTFSFVIKREDVTLSAGRTAAASDWIGIRGPA